MSDSHCVYLLATNEQLIGTASGVLTFSESDLVNTPLIASYPLGLLENADYRVAIVAEGELPASVDPEALCGLRTMLAAVEDESTYTLLSSAAQIVTWHESFKYCPRCAAPLEAHQNELAKVCGSCFHRQYPRISPCIIVLVRKGDQCLLAHASKFAPGRYSALAGFIEAGESAENAVVREVKEEVGIRIKNLTYCFSQSWPFPHSFMLGYMAEYDSGEITPDGEEILDAGWFSASDLPVLPPKFTIARRLIDRFLIDIGESLPEDSALFFTAE
ncbi:NAD(+) diphosphatase [Neptuniibacter marinus]|uniref:NAD(+) diphosphatase n=1 Tax=Neptuniibacter marinus TaxID=1806670 RepID=UPI00082CEE4C|nr:NAD(+) diphosphatase [Neptuniibacter marinus]